MTPLFTKLNLGSRREILVCNAPESFETELAGLSDVAVARDPSAVAAVIFAVAFVRTLAEVEAVAAWLPKAAGDAVVWLAYPKASSKRYRCEFNRDTGWAAVGAAGFEGVRQVAIDADWSGVRCRRTEYIPSLTRDVSRASSPAGKARARGGRRETTSPKIAEADSAPPTVQRCPICSAEVRPNPRYPRHVCGQCAAQASSADGRLLEFFNVGGWGGYAARYADTLEAYPSHECFVAGIPCRADEARFGGIVIEAVGES